MSAKKILSIPQRRLFFGLGLIALLGLLVIIFEDDFHKSSLDPKLPFQIYTPPQAPDYTKSQSWYLNPALSGYYPDPRKIDVFFIHATSFSGGKDWIGSIDDPISQSIVIEEQLPNFAGPFAVIGNIYAPKYRQASLYTQFSRHEDSLLARSFSYQDVVKSFEQFLKTRKGGKGFILIGVEQGGFLASRLMTQRIAHDEALSRQLIVAYFLETAITEPKGPPKSQLSACQSRTQTHCLVTYLSADAARPDKALALKRRGASWSDQFDVIPLDQGPLICVNPMTGAQGTMSATWQQGRGAANATGLDWPTQPGLTLRKVQSRCFGGMLLAEKAQMEGFRAPTDWIAKQRVRPYNLFYGDLAYDAKTRLDTYKKVEANVSN